MSVTEGTTTELVRKVSRIVDNGNNTLVVSFDASGGLDVNSIPANVATVRTSQDLSAGALDFTTSIATNFKIEQIEINFSVTVTEKIIIIQIDDDTNYSTDAWRDATATARDDFRFTPSLDGDIKCYDSEQVNVQCTDTGGAGTAYVKISYSY